MLKMILNYHDRLDRMQFVSKTKQNNDVTNRIDVIYIEDKTELL